MQSAGGWKLERRNTPRKEKSTTLGAYSSPEQLKSAVLYDGYHDATLGLTPPRLRNARRADRKRANGSAPSRPWRAPDCYAVVFQHVSPVKANLNDGYIGEPRGEAPADMLLAVFGGPCEDICGALASSRGSSVTLLHFQRCDRFFEITNENLELAACRQELEAVIFNDK